MSENYSLFQSDSSEEDTNELETDAVTIQLDHDQYIHINDLQLCKHSQLIRDNYLISDVRFKLPKDIQKFQHKNKIKTENVISFFKLLQDENTPMTNDKYIDFLKLSDFFQIKKLTKNLTKYYKQNETNIDFIIQSILSTIEKNDDLDDYQFNFSAKIEDILISHIDEFLKNENTIKLPVSLIYRILDKCNKNKISKNDLFDLIMKSIDNFYALFTFFDIKSITDEQLEKLLEIYNNSKSDSYKYLQFLQCDLNYINELRTNNKKIIELSEIEKNKLLIENDQLKKEKEQLQSDFNKIEQNYNKLKSRLLEFRQKNDLANSNLDQMKQEMLSLKLINEMHQSDMLDLKSINSQLKDRLDKAEKNNNQLQSEIVNYQKSNSQLTTKIADITKNSNNLQSTIFQLKEQNESLQSEYYEAVQKKKQIKSKAATLENENNMLSTKIKELQNLVIQYQNQINPYQNQINQNQIYSYQNQNQINQYQKESLQKQNLQINRFMSQPPNAGNSYIYPSFDQTNVK